MIDEKEMFRVFNMGIGIIVTPDELDESDALYKIGETTLSDDGVSIV